MYRRNTMAKRYMPHSCQGRQGHKKLSNVLMLSNVSFLANLFVHHDLLIKMLLGSKAETMLVKQPFFIQTKMYRLHRKMNLYGHFFI